MVKKSPQKQNEISQKEIEDFFEKMDRRGNFIPAPTSDRDITSDWITTDNSSKGSGRLVTVSAWQTGQKS
ncbi:MAG: hypothetical protein OYG31_00570 [Candidatus Kaiserbacteria bacterium]|nr:hypothetical protein [Candidatus Kaiserbacteria bacterium]